MKYNERLQGVISYFREDDVLFLASQRYKRYCKYFANFRRYFIRPVDNVECFFDTVAVLATMSNVERVFRQISSFRLNMFNLIRLCRQKTK